jgi:CBS domain-containing protein
MVDVREELVRKVMSKIVIAVEPGMNVRDALALAGEHGVTHLPVVAEGRTLGMVCACELDGASGDSNVSELMHSPPVSVAPHETFGKAIRVMVEREVGSVLVLDSSALLGILTRTDVERAGLAASSFGDRRCAGCGAYQHLRARADTGALECWACRRRRTNASSGVT